MPRIQAHFAHWHCVEQLDCKHWPSAWSDETPFGCAVPQLFSQVVSPCAQLLRQSRSAVHSELFMHAVYDEQHEAPMHASHAGTPVLTPEHVPPLLDPLLEPLLVLLLVPLLPLLVLLLLWHSAVAACAAAVQSVHDAQAYELPLVVFQRALEQTPPVVL
jgi:hypothetical protein